MSRSKTGYLYALSAAVFFAAIAILSKTVLNSGVGTFELMFWQYACIIVLLAAFLLLKQPETLRIDGRTLRSLALLGLIGSAATNVFFYLALQQLSAGMTSMLLFTNPIFITFYLWLSKSRTIHRSQWAAVTMAFIGCVLVLDLIGDGAVTPLAGVGMGLLSGVSYAFYNIYADLKLRHVDANVINFYSSVFAILLPIGLMAFTRTPLRILNLEQYATIGLLAVVAGILPIFLIFQAIRRIGSEKASVVATMELPMTILLAAIFLKERMSLTQMAGIVLISAASFLLQRSDRQSLPHKN